MGFGLNVKVEVPKVDIAAAVTGAADAAKGAASEAVTGAIGGAIGAAKGAVGGALAALSTVAGAIADVEASFKGLSVDMAVEPHVTLDANASYEKTKFENGPIWIRIEMTSDEASRKNDVLHLFSDTKEFDQKMNVSEFKDVTGRTVDVLFKDAPMSAKYTLEIIPEEQEPYTVFTDVAYGDLRRSEKS